ncbi:Cleavage polyadenylation factor subunit clp1 [Lambiella insularis]|nr:Cleavage polyadenylation factor subunit clp1 [Lambiella insularis]
MSLPGLQLNSIPVEEKTSTVHEISSGTEWRFEVAFGEDVEVKLLSGTAEIFGTELALNQTYVFNGRKAAVFSWHGCRLEVTGKCHVDYIAEETPMTTYINTHFALENLRSTAVEENSLGPRVLVVGAENAGKTTLVKLLSAYASRSERQPVVVNLDPKEGLLSIPGTLSTIVLDSVVDVEQGWGSSPMNGPSPVPVKLPLVYYYGMEDPEAQGAFYKPIVTRLALSVMSRLEEDQEAKPSGCIIDTSGSISLGKAGYDIIRHIVAEFSGELFCNLSTVSTLRLLTEVVNVLIVLGSERLYNDMSKRFAKQSSSAHESVSVIKLDKSGGCVDRDSEYMDQLRQAQIREYFFGDARTPLSPHTQQIDFSELAVYRFAEPSAGVMSSFLPGGEVEDVPKDVVFDRVQPSAEMQSRVLAVVQAEPNESPEGVRDASVVGFIYVAEVDEKKRKVRILAPMGGRVPRKAMVWGLWPEVMGELVG